MSADEATALVRDLAVFIVSLLPVPEANNSKAVPMNGQLGTEAA
jgi:hypothetical protein